MVRELLYPGMKQCLDYSSGVCEFRDYSPTWGINVDIPVLSTSTDLGEARKIGETAQLEFNKEVQNTKRTLEGLRNDTRDYDTLCTLRSNQERAKKSVDEKTNAFNEAKKARDDSIRAGDVALKNAKWHVIRLMRNQEKRLEMKM